MLSNTVAHNEIWREHVRKEDRLCRTPVKFRVNRAHTARSILPLKIGTPDLGDTPRSKMHESSSSPALSATTKRAQTTPSPGQRRCGGPPQRSLPKVVTPEEKQSRYEEMVQALQASGRGAIETNAHAMTSSQEYGWLIYRPCSPQPRPVSPWKWPKKSCEITRFADVYSDTYHISPFSTKGLKQ